MIPFFLPSTALEALQGGADCAVGLSGGKDSMALLLKFVPWFRAQGFSGSLFAIFAHLGRAEWWQTEGFVTQLSAQIGIELVIVRVIIPMVLQIGGTNVLQIPRLSIELWSCKW